MAVMETTQFRCKFSDVSLMQSLLHSAGTPDFICQDYFVTA